MSGWPVCFALPPLGKSILGAHSLAQAERPQVRPSLWSQCSSQLWFTEVSFMLELQQRKSAFDSSLRGSGATSTCCDDERSWKCGTIINWCASHLSLKFEWLSILGTVVLCWITYLFNYNYYKLMLIIKKKHYFTSNRQGFWPSKPLSLLLLHSVFCTPTYTKPPAMHS